jgi:hypothetical protein
MGEQELIQTAAGNIPDNLGVVITWLDNVQDETDGQIRLKFNDKELLFNVEIKKELREHQLPKLEFEAKNNPPFILLAQYLRPKIKDELRKRNIAYLELNGNLFINQKDLVILIEANKPVDLAKETGNRAFTKTGLKIVFQYLTDEKWVNQTQRVIATHTNTGLGNINNVNFGLEKEGFLLKLNKTEKRLQNKKTLLDKWMKGFDITLKPTLRLGRFRFLNKTDFNNWKNITLDKQTTWWGGEPAANLLTDYLYPEELTLYTTRNRTDLMKELRLIPDPDGDVIIYHIFWNRKDTENQNTVPALLVYTDLMNTGDNRCHETARMIWDKYLAHEF